jgi:hypothetical protein
VRSRALRPSERGNSGRWHIHCAIELPSHVDPETFERLINECWAKVDWGYDRVLVGKGTDRGWIDGRDQPPHDAPPLLIEK